MADRVVRVHVSGRVQGVFFRDSTLRRASELGLSGWVRNLHDGRVEALFAGPAERVAEAIAWCREGPPEARVEDIAVEEAATAPPGPGFRILPTA